MSGGGSFYAPFLIGAFISCMLYGVTVVQCYLYFQSCKRDRWWLKAFVSYLMVFETLSMIFNISVAYEPLIVHYGNPEVLIYMPIMLVTVPLLTVIISMPVQLFFAWRIKVITKSFILPTIVSFFSVVAFIGGVTTSALLVHIDFRYSLIQNDIGAIIPWLVSTVAADVTITTSLVVTLLRKRTGFPDTDSTINKIILMTVQTGSITSIFALLDLILFMGFKGKTWNFVLDLPLSKLYSNTILSTLNARSIRKYNRSPRVNILFASDGSTEGSQSQIEAVTMKTFDSGLDDHHREGPRLEINVAQECSVTL